MILVIPKMELFMACFSTDLPRDDQSKTKLKTASVVNLPFEYFVC